MAKRALITGITGQAGSYLAELLLSKGYEVHGLVRHVAIDTDKRFGRIQHLLGKITLHPGVIESYERLLDVVDTVRPDECYHLAAQSFVKESFDDEFSTFLTNTSGTHFILSAIAKRSPATRFYFASSSEMFGKVRETPQTELTPFHPRSTYGISKVAGFEFVRHYREARGLYAVSGILFNHESPRRGLEFVTRKITHGLAHAAYGLGNELRIGNLNARRDWGFAGDYMDAVWRMMQQAEPRDYVIASGVQHSVRQFIAEAAQHVQVNIEWRGTGADERGIDTRTGKTVVAIDSKYFRPAEVDTLCGDASRAHAELSWKPAVSFQQLVKMMVDADVERLKKR